MRLYNFQPLVLKKGEPPTLPETIEEVNEVLSRTKGRLKILRHGKIAQFGTSSECSVILECPFCKSQFTGYHEEGCFHSRTAPMTCPICNFPNVIWGQLRKCKKC